MAGQPQAIARVYAGQWIANCIRPGCMNAEALAPGAWVVACRNCQWSGPVLWPVNAPEISLELARRPVPGTRNWFPKDHPIALASGTPHGQSVAELAEEFAANDPIAAKADR